VAAYAQVSKAPGRHVTDTQAALFPGMTVTVTSPALIGQRTAVSEIDGRLSRHESAIGPYAVKFDLQVSSRSCARTSWSRRAPP